MKQKNNKKVIGAIAAIGVVAVIGVAAWGLTGDPAADAVLDGATSAGVVPSTAAETSAEADKPKKDADKKDKEEKASEEAEDREGEEAVDAQSESEDHPSEASESENQQADEGQNDDSFTWGDNSNSEGNSTVGGGDPSQSKQDQSGSTKPAKEQSKPSSGGKTDSGKSDESGKGGDSRPAAQDTRKKVWVDPVYEEVYHEEVGHWETKTRTVTKVICGGTDHNPGDPNYDGPFGGPSPVFDDVAGWKAHQEAFIAEMRKDDPYYQCTGRHRPAKEIQVEESYDEWVVDEEAWTEQVLVSEGHWDYE